MTSDRKGDRASESGAPDVVVPIEVIDKVIDSEVDILSGTSLTPDELDPFGGSKPLSFDVPAGYSLVPVDSDSDALVAADPLTAYLARLRYIEPLAPERQQELAERYQETGEPEAARLLILSNVRLVVKIAREYRRRREDLMELIQEGNVGLSHAIQRYDPYRGVKFSSYAQYWVRAMILNYLMNVQQSVKIGSTRAGRKLFFNLKRERERLLRETNVQPSTRLLAESLGVGESEVVDVMRVIDTPPLSIDAPAPGFEKSPLGAILPDTEAASPEETVLSEDLRSKFSAVLTEFGSGLTDEREKAIWSRRILSEDPLSLRELGEEFGVSRERIRQIEAKLKKRVELFLRKRMGEEAIELAISN